MRAVVLTSTSPRHHFLVHTVARRLDVVGVWRERREFNVDAVRRMLANVTDRMVDEYLSAREVRDAQLSLVTPRLEASPIERRVL